MVSRCYTLKSLILLNGFKNNDSLCKWYLTILLFKCHNWYKVRVSVYSL
jgi:hypothetical protein